MPFFPPLLALGEADHPYMVYAALLGVMALITAVNGITEIIERYRTKPALHETYATKAETADLREKLDGIVNGKWASRDEVERAHERIDTISGEFHEAAQKITDALKKDLEEHRKETASLANGLAAIHRTLGQLEGKIESIQTKRSPR